VDLRLSGVEPASVARLTYFGREDCDLPAGKVLTIETAPRGEELLSATVPKGKRWAVQITVSIAETDA